MNLGMLLIVYCWRISNEQVKAIISFNRGNSFKKHGKVIFRGFCGSFSQAVFWLIELQGK